MSIPDYQTIMQPLLEYISDKKEHAKKDIINSLAIKFKITDEEQKKMLASGKQSVFHNRVGWALSYLKKSLLISSPQRAVFCITPRGSDALEFKGVIDNQYLKQFKEFQHFTRGLNNKIEDKQEKEKINTPDEILENTYMEIRNSLAQELLAKLKESSPYFFELLVVDLLLAMGYGGSRKEAGKAIGKSKDEGIDGIINEDKLGLDIIYIQAKRWEGAVSRPEIQKFVGALQGKRAKKGIFITTSSYTKEAKIYTENIENKVILIDGLELAEFMIDYNVGVTKITSYELKKMDLDYFEEN